MERKPKGRRRTVAMLLAAAVAMVTFGVSSATTAGAITNPVNANPLPYTAVGGCTVSTSGLVASAKVTWTKPSPSDYIAGYLITISPGAGDTAISDTPPPFPVSGADTLTATVLNLIPGKHYNFVIQSVNLDASVNPALTPAQCNNPAFPIVPNAAGVAPQAAAYVFPTNRASIVRHYEEFLQRDPNFSELSFWDRYYFNSNALIGTCGTGGKGTNIPEQFALDPKATSTIGGFCPNSGPEFDLINFLYFGENNAGRQPFDTGGYYDNFNRKTYAGTAEPVIRLYTAYFGRIPDGGGFKYWYNKYKAGKSLYSISDFFAKSTEFKKQYGSLSDADFVTLVYVNVLARNEDFGGQNFWRGQLESGISRGQVMAKFSESDEYNRITNYEVKTIALYEAMLGYTFKDAKPSKKVPGSATAPNTDRGPANVDTIVNLMNNQWDAWCINSFNNEIQTITLNTLTTSYTLSFTRNGSTATTGAIAYNATSATIQAALEVLPTIGAGNVSVAGPNGGPYSVEFKGALANQDVANLVAGNILPVGPPAGTVTIGNPTPGGQHGSVQYHYDSAVLRDSGTTDLTGGHLMSTSTLSCLQSTAGHAPAGYGGESVFYTEHANENQQITEGGSGLTSFTLTFNGLTTAAIPSNATASQVQAALEALGTIGVGNVFVSGAQGGPYTIEFVGALGNQNVNQLTATPTGGTGTVTPQTLNDGLAAHAGTAYYTSPIVNLIATIRNSPAYTTAVGKPAALI